MNNYIHIKQWNVITHTGPNLNGGLAKLLLILWLGWVIISHYTKTMDVTRRVDGNADILSRSLTLSSASRSHSGCFTSGHPIDSLPFHSMTIGPPIPQNWPWKFSISIKISGELVNSWESMWGVIWNVEKWCYWTMFRGPKLPQYSSWNSLRKLNDWFFYLPGGGQREYWMII